MSFISWSSLTVDISSAPRLMEKEKFLVVDDLQGCLVVFSKVYELVTAEALDVISPGEHVINHGGGEGRAWGRCCLGGGCSSTFLSPYPEELEPDPHLVDS